MRTQPLVPLQVLGCDIQLQSVQVCRRFWTELGFWGKRSIEEVTPRRYQWHRWKESQNHWTDWEDARWFFSSVRIQHEIFDSQGNSDLCVAPSGLVGVRAQIS